jgi:hypothetical protein
MKTDLTTYINRYYRHLYTADEGKAERHMYNFARVKDDPADSSKRKMLEEKGWISNDLNVLKLLDDGPDAFYEAIAKRIFIEQSDKLFFNYCPRCGGLARTPSAKLCPNCFHSWHDKQETLQQPVVLPYKPFYGEGERQYNKQPHPVDKRRFLRNNLLGRLVAFIFGKRLN